MLDPVHIPPAEFRNEGFTLRTHQMFSVHTPPVKTENATITAHIGFVLDLNSVREIKTFSFHIKTTNRRFQIPISRAFSKSSVFVTD